MPISLRLPVEIESQIAGFGARLGLTKSAVIVRSIEEFLAHHAQPSSLEIYEAAMRAASPESVPAAVVDANGSRELRAHKLKVRAAIARKHAERSKHAVIGAPAEHVVQKQRNHRVKSQRAVAKPA